MSKMDLDERSLSEAMLKIRRINRVARAIHAKLQQSANDYVGEYQNRYGLRLTQIEGDFDLEALAVAAIDAVLECERGAARTPSVFPPTDEEKAAERKRGEGFVARVRATRRAW